MATNFALNDRWTFARSEASYDFSWPMRLTRYYGSAVSGLVVQLSVLNAARYVLTLLPWPEQWLSMRFYFANLCGIVGGTVINYVVSKKFVFQRNPK